jgi:hypothetical protein
MRFARFVFIGAGLWGIAVLTPFYRLVDVTGRVYPPPVDYQQFFWGFFGVALAWQIAFLVIGSNPVRFRPLMIPAVVEKLGWVVTLLVLRAQARISPLDVAPALPDFVLGILFLAAFVKARGAVPSEAEYQAVTRN